MKLNLAYRHPRLAALLLGMAAATGFAPLCWWPVTIGALAGWLFLVATAPTLRAALERGWLFGWAMLTAANMWIATAFTYQDAMPHWLGAPAVALLCVYLALYPMAAAGIIWAARRRGQHPDLAFALAAGAAWMLTEWARGTWLTGYPWPPLATIWLPVLGVAQIAQWTGTYALSGLTVAAAATLTIAMHGRWRAASVAMVAGGALALNGMSLPLTPVAPPADTPRLRVEQPYLDQEQRPRDDYAEANLRVLERLAGTPGTAPRLLLWPEGALRYFIEDGYPPRAYWQGDPVAIRQRIARLLGPRDMVLTGGNAVQFTRDGDIASITNSIFVIDARGQIRARYDKAHLVPWGEYLPWRPLLSKIGLNRLVPGDYDFAPGTGPRSFGLPGFGTVGMLVCYEVIFSGNIVDPAHRPAFLFNPSNDSWYARFGPEQHLAQARLRAIEEGLPIVRATPTGISAIVDANGHIVVDAKWNRRGAIEAPIPPANPPTLFARLGNAVVAAIASILLTFVVALRRRSR